jgi:hypothetical protein
MARGATASPAGGGSHQAAAPRAGGRRGGESQTRSGSPSRPSPDPTTRSVSSSSPISSRRKWAATIPVGHRFQVGHRLRRSAIGGSHPNAKWCVSPQPSSDSIDQVPNASLEPAALPPRAVRRGRHRGSWGEGEALSGARFRGSENRGQARGVSIRWRRRSGSLATEHWIRRKR